MVSWKSWFVLVCLLWGMSTDAQANRRLICRARCKVTSGLGKCAVAAKKSQIKCRKDHATKLSKICDPPYRKCRQKALNDCLNCKKQCQSAHNGCLKSTNLGCHSRCKGSLACSNGCRREGYKGCKQKKTACELKCSQRSLVSCQNWAVKLCNNSHQSCQARLNKGLKACLQFIVALKAICQRKATPAYQSCVNKCR